MELMLLGIEEETIKVAKPNSIVTKVINPNTIVTKTR
jgi:hypothetical protein